MLIDTHSHFDVDSFDADRAQVLARAQAAGVMQQVVPAIDAAGWPRVRDACASHPGLFAAYGLHPIYLDAHRPQHLDLLRAWLESEPCVAVGECGLDFYVEGLDADAQTFYFDAQLKLAREFELPVIVHARRAVDAVIAAIRRIGGLTGVVHSFPGSREQAEQLYKLGFMLGIGGPVTYERANRLRALVATMPIEYLLLETDAPDQPDSAWRGQRNEPARMTVVRDTVAELRGVDAEVIDVATTANAQRLFKLPMTVSA